MAATVAGAIPQSCAKCRRHPELKEPWGCLKPQPLAVEVLLDDDGDELHFHSCPMLFIPGTIWEWYERYSYLQKYPHTAPEFDKQDPRFLAFERYFIGRLRDYESRLKEGGVN